MPQRANSPVGSGLIGAHVVDVLRERGHAATAVARTARVGGTGLLVRLDHDCFHQPWEGDLDFVVTPHTITSYSTDARTLLEDIRTAIRTATGAGVQPDRISSVRE